MSWFRHRLGYVMRKTAEHSDHGVVTETWAWVRVRPWWKVWQNP